MKLTREQTNRVEALALKLYAEANPRPLEVIKVSKAECLKRAQARLFPKPTR